MSVIVNVSFIDFIVTLYFSNAVSMLPQNP